MSVYSLKTPYHCRQRPTASLLAATLSLGLLVTIEPLMAQFVPVCDRTPAVRDEIVKLVPEIDDCADVTKTHLAAIRGAFFHSGYDSTSNGTQSERNRRPPPPVKMLRAGDFSGLSSVTTLYLDRTPLTTLPAEAFSGLSSLSILDLSRSQLTSLPVGVFSGLPFLQILDLSQNKLTALPVGIFASLSNLEILLLHRNELTSLPVGVFSGLPSLEALNLDANRLTSLPVGVFSGLPFLQTLDLSQNKLTALPVGIFASLSNLEILLLHRNELTSLPVGVFSGLPSLGTLFLFENRLTSLPVGFFSDLSSVGGLVLGANFASPLPVNVSLEWVGPGRFQARVHAGAPFEMRVPITIINGTFDGESSHLTIPAGRGESDILSVSRRPGTTLPVTVEIAQFPKIPQGHGGYALVKAAAPLLVLGGLSLDFPHFANGASINSELVIVNVAATPIQPILYFFDNGGKPH